MTTYGANAENTANPDGKSLAAETPHEPLYRRNFILFLLDNFLFNVAFSIIGPSTFIPDFVRQLTSSEVLIGFSSSLFQATSTLPQLGMARVLRGRELVKRWYVVPNIPARLMILMLPGVILLLGAERPTALLIAFFVLYALAALGTGVSNLAWWTMAASSLDARWRARVLGLTTLTSGVVLISLLPLIARILGSEALVFPANYALIFGISGGIFAVATVPMLFVRELPTVTTASHPVEADTPTEALSKRRFLATLSAVLALDKAYRIMVVARVLTEFMLMAAPFYIGFATVELGLSSTTALPLLLGMQTTGMIAGAVLYVWLGARSNTLVMRIAVCAVPLTPLCALLASETRPQPLYLGILIAGMAVGNLMTSYQNWVIMWPDPPERPVYAGLYNTISAVFTLGAPVLAGAIVHFLGFRSLFAIALTMGILTLTLVLRITGKAPDRLSSHSLPANH